MRILRYCTPNERCRCLHGVNRQQPFEQWWQASTEQCWQASTHVTSTEAGSAARSSPRANAKHAVEAAANFARQLTSSSLATSVRSSGGIGESVLQGPFDSAFDMPGRPHDSRPCPARRKKRARAPIKVKSQLGRGGRSDPLSRYFSRAHEGSVMRQQWSSADWQGDAGSGLCPDPKLC